MRAVSSLPQPAIFPIFFPVPRHVHPARSRQHATNLHIIDRNPPAAPPATPTTASMPTFTLPLRPALRAVRSAIVPPTKRFKTGGGWLKIRSSTTRPRVFHSPRTPPPSTLSRPAPLTPS